MHPDKSRFEHIDEFHKLVGDLAAIDTAISDEDQTLLLLMSLPSSYDNFVETLLYGQDTLKLEDVLMTLNSKELQKMTKAKGDGGERLYSEEHLKMDCPTYNHKKSQDFVRNEDHVSGSRADGYDNVDVMMVMSVEQLLDWIMNSRGSYHMTYRIDYLVDFKEYYSDNVLLGDGSKCGVRGMSKVSVQMKDGSSLVSDNVMYVLKLRRNLISLGTFKKEGYTVKMQSGKIKVIKGLPMVLSGTRRANCVYTLDDQTVTMKTLKGRKHLGEYHTGWKIKMGNVLDCCNQGSTQQCMKSGVSGLPKVFWSEDTTMSTYLLNRSGVLQGIKFEVESREDHAFEVEPLRNVGQGVVEEVEKIYANESLAFNDTITCEVIFKWKTGLEEDMDAWSHVYVLNNGCRKSSDDVDGYYWEYTPDRQDQSGNTLRVSWSWVHNEKLIQILLEGHSILSLEGSLSGDCDVKKN
ncbi:hypothetical protein Tco_1158439, partial [Tanacetum coccineum]